jgi:hypothetical protein
MNMAGIEGFYKNRDFVIPSTSPRTIQAILILAIG